MTFATDYWAIINAVKTEVEKSKKTETYPNRPLTDVIIGMKAENVNFPFAAVIPGQDIIRAETTAKMRHSISVKVVVINEDTNPLTCLHNCLDYGLAIYGDLVDDADLGGTANTIVGASFEPAYELGSEVTLVWVVITVSISKVRTVGNS